MSSQEGNKVKSPQKSQNRRSVSHCRGEKVSERRESWKVKEKVTDEVVNLQPLNHWPLGPFFHSWLLYPQSSDRVGHNWPTKATESNCAKQLAIGRKGKSVSEYRKEKRVQCTTGLMDLRVPRWPGVFISLLYLPLGPVTLSRGSAKVTFCSLGHPSVVHGSIAFTLVKKNGNWGMDVEKLTKRKKVTVRRILVARARLKD